MIKQLISVFLGFSASTAGAVTDSWPELPRTGFITGRAAEEADIDRGDAVFVSRFGGVLSGKPVGLQIPQFAYLIGPDGVGTPVVVVQVEANEKGTFFGLRDADGNAYVATEHEVELLGSTHP